MWTGKYLIIKYSTNKNRSINIYANTIAAAHTPTGKPQARMDIIINATDKDVFNVAVYDLEAGVNQRSAGSYDSKNPLKYFRIDYINDWAAFTQDDYIEYAYVGLADTLEHVKAALTKLGDMPTQTTCGHGVCDYSSNYSYSLYEKVYVDNDGHNEICVLCEKVIGTAAHFDDTLVYENGSYKGTCIDCGAEYTTPLNLLVEAEDI